MNGQSSDIRKSFLLLPEVLLPPVVGKKCGGYKIYIYWYTIYPLKIAGLLVR